MKLHNNKTGLVIDTDIADIKFQSEKIIIIPEPIMHNGLRYAYRSLSKLKEDWEDYKPAEPLIKDEKIRSIIRAWAKYNKTESVYAYNLVFDHSGVCIKNALVEFYDPLLRTNIIIWFQTEAPTFKKEHKYTIEELCGKEE